MYVIELTEIIKKTSKKFMLFGVGQRCDVSPRVRSSGTSRLNCFRSDRNCSVPRYRRSCGKWVDSPHCDVSGVSSVSSLCLTIAFVPARFFLAAPNRFFCVFFTILVHCAPTSPTTEFSAFATFVWFVFAAASLLPVWFTVWSWTVTSPGRTVTPLAGTTNFCPLCVLYLLLWLFRILLVCVRVWCFFEFSNCNMPQFPTRGHSNLLVPVHQVATFFSFCKTSRETAFSTFWVAARTRLAFTQKIQATVSRPAVAVPSHGFTPAVAVPSHSFTPSNGCSHTQLLVVRWSDCISALRDTLKRIAELRADFHVFFLCCNLFVYVTGFVLSSVSLRGFALWRMNVAAPSLFFWNKSNAARLPAKYSAQFQVDCPSVQPWSDWWINAPDHPPIWFEVASNYICEILIRKSKKLIQRFLTFFLHILPLHQTKLPVSPPIHSTVLIY